MASDNPVRARGARPAPILFFALVFSLALPALADPDDPPTPTTTQTTQTTQTSTTTQPSQTDPPAPPPERTRTHAGPPRPDPSGDDRDLFTRRWDLTRDALQIADHALTTGAALDPMELVRFHPDYRYLSEEDKQDLARTVREYVADVTRRRTGGDDLDNDVPQPPTVRRAPAPTTQSDQLQNNNNNTTPPSTPPRVEPRAETHPAAILPPTTTHPETGRGETIPPAPGMTSLDPIHPTLTKGAPMGDPADRVATVDAPAKPAGPVAPAAPVPPPAPVTSPALAKPGAVPEKGPAADVPAPREDASKLPMHHSALADGTGPAPAGGYGPPIVGPLTADRATAAQPASLLPKTDALALSGGPPGEPPRIGMPAMARAAMAFDSLPEERDAEARRAGRPMSRATAGEGEGSAATAARGAKAGTSAETAPEATSSALVLGTKRAPPADEKGSLPAPAPSTSGTKKRAIEITAGTKAVPTGTTPPWAKGVIEATAGSPSGLARAIAESMDSGPRWRKMFEGLKARFLAMQSRLTGREPRAPGRAHASSGKEPSLGTGRFAGPKLAAALLVDEERAVASDATSSEPGLPVTASVAQVQWPAAVVVALLFFALVTLRLHRRSRRRAS